MTKDFSGEIVNGPYKGQSRVHYARTFVVTVRIGAIMYTGYYEFMADRWYWNGRSTP